MLKWNKALRARQAELRKEQQKEDARRAAELGERVSERELEDGTTLNRLLTQIFDFDPAASRSGRAKGTVSATAVKEIPFEWDTEAITLCVDQMTGRAPSPTA